MYRRVARPLGPAVVAFGLLSMSGACEGAAAQADAPNPNQGLRAQLSDDLQPLTLAGIVFDASTGAPLQAAQVYLEDTDVGALSNQNGAFRLTAPNAGVFQLRIDLIGYRSETLAVEIDDSGGAVLQAGLTFSPIPLCGLMVCAAPGCPTGAIRTQIRDLATGSAPDVPVRLEARSAFDTLSVMSEPAGGDSLSLDLSFREPLGAMGPFELVVTSPEHVPWRIDDLWLEEQPCGWPASGLLFVWLVGRR